MNEFFFVKKKKKIGYNLELFYLLSPTVEQNCINLL